MGGEQPYRGVVAGLVELVGALFLPRPLRVVVGAIGALRVIYGAWAAGRQGRQEEVS